MSGAWEELRSAGREQLALRGAIVVAGLVFAVAAAATGGADLWADPWFAVAIPALALLAALSPHTFLPAVLMLYLVGVWITGTPELWTPWAPLAAACLLVIHTAAAIATSVPAQATLPARLWRLYLPRVAVLLGAAVAVWAVVGLVHGRTVPGGPAAMVTGLAVVTAGLLAHQRAVIRRTRQD
ncbi:hypothetical protein GCM10023169_26120 [Georgenia halophila]|uniref:Uncharacterized protein n=1 Tax=Georgenia halophila TaxID=620889 RepID=A0ABP8LDH0_9MICO